MATQVSSIASALSSAFIPIHKSVVSSSSSHGRAPFKIPRRDLVVFCADQTKKESSSSSSSSSDNDEGNVSTGVYEEYCEFADPAGSFKSLKRFKNNCSNFGKLLEKSDVKLVRSKKLPDKFVAYWRFSCVLNFPWKPILSSTGFTEYYFDSTSGRICRHVENWDVPKMALLGQVFKPNPSLAKKKV